MPDDLDWKRDRMRKVAAQASEYAKSAAAQVQPTPMPSNADALMAQYGGQGLPPANGGDPSGTYGPVAQGKPDLQGSSLTGNNPSTATDPESVPGTAIEAGAAESIHAAGDIASAAPAPMLYAGRKVGKGIVSAMGGQLPAQQQSDKAGLWGDITSPFTRGYARATGDFSQAPNKRQGLTSSTMGEIGEAGGLALDPNASWGERALGGLGAVAGAGAMLLSGKGVGGLPEGLDPGLAVSSRIDRANLARLAAGRGTIPNPTLGELFAGATKELPKPSRNRIGFDRRGALGNLEPSDADLSKEEFLKQAQRKRQVEELQKRLGEKFAPPPAPGEQAAAAPPPLTEQPPAPATSKPDMHAVAVLRSLSPEDRARLQMHFEAKYERNGKLDPAKDMLNDIADTLAGRMQLNKAMRENPEGVIRALDESVYAGKPKKPPAQAAAEPRTNAFGETVLPAPPEFQGTVADAIKDLIQEKYSVHGMVPIHEIRDAVRAKLGDAAASHKVFDQALLDMRREHGLRVIPISDRSRATAEQLQGGIKGLGETLYYVENDRELARGVKPPTPLTAKLTEQPAAPASVPANNKPVMAGFPKVDGVAEVRKSPDFASTGERLVKLDNGEVHPIYYDKSTGGYYHANHVNDDAQRGFIAFDKKEVLERLVGTKGYREYTPNNPAMAKLTEAPGTANAAPVEQPGMAPPEVAPAESVPAMEKSDARQAAAAEAPGRGQQATPAPEATGGGQQAPAGQQVAPPSSSFTGDTGVPTYTEGSTASVGPSKYFKGYGNKPGIANQPGYVEPKPPVEPTINPTVEDASSYTGTDTGSYTGYAGNDNPKGRIQDTVQTPGGEEVGGFGGPQRWRLRRAESPAVKADVNQPALYPEEGPGPWGPDQQPVNKPIHGPNRDDRPFYGPGGEGIEQGPGPFGPEQGPANQPPLQGPGPWGEANGPERRPKNLPTPWVPNKYFANKFGSIFSTRLTGVLNSDNQLERLERIGAEAARQAKNYPGRFSPEQLDAINAIHETVERVKSANEKTRRWYKEIGPAIEEATSQLLGPRWKRSAEALDLKKYNYAENPDGTVRDSRVQYSNMTALMDDLIHNELFPNMKPLNDKQARFIETAKQAMEYTSGKSAEVGMVTTGPGGRQYWQGQEGLGKMLRSMPPETKYLMEHDHALRDKIIGIILEQPGNEGIKMEDAIAEFAGAYSTPEKQSALEHLRVIKNMPDRVMVPDSRGKQTWYQLNDFVNQAIPTKDYHGSGMGGVIRGQLQRAAIVDEFGTRGVGSEFKDLIEGKNKGEGLLDRIGNLSKEHGGLEGKNETQSLIAAASGKRNESGFMPTWQVPESVRRQPVYQVAAGLINIARDTATSGVWIKDFMRPIYQAAMEHPGGPIAKLIEAGIVTKDQAWGLFGGAVNKIAGRGIGKYVSQPYTARIAETGHALEDYTNGIWRMAPWWQGEKNALSKTENFMNRFGDLNPFKIGGQIMNDLVFGASEATTANSARRAAKAYIQRGINGAINEADYTKLANDGVSGRSINWLKRLQGEAPADRELFVTRNPTEAGEFATDLAGNMIDRFNKQIGSPTFNQKLINTPAFNKTVPFLGYDYTMQRAGEDTLKTTRSILSLDNISSAEKASLISKKIVNYGVKLGVLDASGEAVRGLIHLITGRQDTDWEKKAPYDITRIVTNLFATRMFGAGAMLADGVAYAFGIPRPWAKAGGKEQAPHIPEGDFMQQSLRKMTAPVIEAGKSVLKSSGVPVKGKVDVGKALLNAAGPMAKAILPAPQPAAKGGGRTSSDALKLFGGSKAPLVAPPMPQQRKSSGRTSGDALKLFK